VCFGLMDGAEEGCVVDEGVDKYVGIVPGQATCSMRGGSRSLRLVFAMLLLLLVGSYRT